MRHECEVTNCSEGTFDVICRSCRAELLAALCELVFIASSTGQLGPGLLQALDDMVVRRKKLGASQPVRGRDAEGPPTPYDPHASRVADEARNTISTWARFFADAFPSLTADYTTLNGACRWLASYSRELAVYREAAQMHREITRLVERIEHAVDRHDELLYAGICSAPLEGGRECDEDLFARPDRGTVTCRVCRTSHVVADRREKLFRHAENQLATAADCSRIVPNLLGRELSASTIRHWAREGRLSQRTPHPHDERQLPRYRIGDVVSVARNAQTRRRKTGKQPARNGG